MSGDVLIRRATPEDAGAIAGLAVGNEMMPQSDAEGMTASIGDGSDSAEWLVVVASSGAVVGAAYVALEAFSDSVWNLYFVAVDPQQHAQGVGTALLAEVESYVGARDEPATALVIETSSLPAYVGARAFYERRGYSRVGEVPDYYGPGDTKVIFWKSLRDMSSTA